MKLKVLHLLSSNSYSGAENVVCQIIDLFRDQIGMAYCSPGGTIARTLLQREIDFVPIERTSIKHTKKAIISYGPDIIHAHDIRASIIASCCSKRIPIISHIHGRFEDMSRISAKSVLYRLCSTKFQHIFAVSKSIIEQYYFSSAIMGKSSVLYNAVNTEKIMTMIHNDRNKRFDCVYLGRFAHAKNPQRLIRIIRKVVYQVPEAKFVLIGDGLLLDEAKGLVKELQLTSNVVFTGYLSNPYPILQSSKLMIMSSRTEGMPMCVLEAMLLGVPVVSTAVDGIKELIDNDVDGFYYNDDDDIVRAIVKLLGDEALRQRMSNTAYEKATKINNLEEYKRNIAEVYSKCALRRKVGEAN